MTVGEIAATPKGQKEPALAPRFSPVMLATIGLPTLFLCLAFVLPLLLLLYISGTREFPLDDRFSLVNYVKIVSETYYFQNALGTLSYGVTVTALSLVLGYPMAYYLVRYSRSGYEFLMLSIISPLLVGVVVRTVGWVILLGTEGLFNEGLRALSVAAPVKILFTNLAAVIGMVHVLLPFMIISIASVLSKLDLTLEEAAQSLGASRLQIFWKVTFPLTIPGVSAGAFLTFALAVGAYITPVLLGGGKMKIISALIYQEITATANWSMGSALSVMLVAVVLLVLALSSLAAFRKGASP